MVMKKYRVTLTEEECVLLKELVSSGKSAARKITHARILLLADEKPGKSNNTDLSIVKSLHVGVVTVERVRQRNSGTATIITQSKNPRSQNVVLISP